MPNSRYYTKYLFLKETENNLCNFMKVSYTSNHIFLVYNETFVSCRLAMTLKRMHNAISRGMVDYHYPCILISMNIKFKTLLLNENVLRSFLFASDLWYLCPNVTCGPLFNELKKNYTQTIKRCLCLEDVRKILPL